MPWILRVPGVAPRREAGVVSLVDVFPTVLSAAGLHPSVSTEGIDQLSTPTSREIFAEHKAPDRYEQSLRSGERKLVREFRLPRPDRAAQDELPMSVGERWEIELSGGADGRLIANQLKLLSDDDAEDPIEIKGMLGVDGVHLRVGSLSVEVDAATERRHARGERDIELRTGRMVKVRGAFDRGGVFAVEWIKFYASDELPVFEIRGPLSRIDGNRARGVVAIGAVEAVVVADTQIKGGKLPTVRMTRSEVLKLAAKGVSHADEGGYSVVENQFRVTPGGLEESAGGEREDLSDAMDRLTRQLRLRATSTPGSSRILSEDTLRELRALGYVD